MKISVLSHQDLKLVRARSDLLPAYRCCRELTNSLISQSEFEFNNPIFRFRIYCVDFSSVVIFLETKPIITRSLVSFVVVNVMLNNNTKFLCSMYVLQAIHANSCVIIHYGRLHSKGQFIVCCCLSSLVADLKLSMSAMLP